MHAAQKFLAESSDAGHIFFHLHSIQSCRGPRSLKSLPDITMLADALEQPTLAIHRQARSLVI
jgi:hypothetical protein